MLWAPSVPRHDPTCLLSQTAHLSLISSRLSQPPSFSPFSLSLSLSSLSLMATTKQSLRSIPSITITCNSNISTFLPLVRLHLPSVQPPTPNTTRTYTYYQPTYTHTSYQHNTNPNPDSTTQSPSPIQPNTKPIGKQHELDRKTLHKLRTTSNNNRHRLWLQSLPPLTSKTPHRPPLNLSSFDPLSLSLQSLCTLSYLHHSRLSLSLTLPRRRLNQPIPPPPIKQLATQQWPNSTLCSTPTINNPLIDFTFTHTRSRELKRKWERSINCLCSVLLYVRCFRIKSSSNGLMGGLNIVIWFVNIWPGFMD